MKLLILGGAICFLFGAAAGAWLLVRIGRRADNRGFAYILEVQEKAERAGFEAGYASALGVTAAIDEPADHERSTR